MLVTLILLVAFVVVLLYYYSQPEWIEWIIDCDKKESVDMFFADEFLRWLSDNRRNTKR